MGVWHVMSEFRPGLRPPTRTGLVLGDQMLPQISRYISTLGATFYSRRKIKTPRSKVGSES